MRASHGAPGASPGGGEVSAERAADASGEVQNPRPVLWAAQNPSSNRWPPLLLSSLEATLFLYTRGPDRLPPEAPPGKGAGHPDSPGTTNSKAQSSLDRRSRARIYGDIGASEASHL